MNHRSLGIAGICGALALTFAMQANAAKTIRQDMNQWDTCPISSDEETLGEPNPCVGLPTGLSLDSFDPFGLGLQPSRMTDKDSADVFGNDFGRELQYGWQSSVPGLDLRYSSEFGSGQVLYFGLGSGSSSELVYLPGYDFQFENGDPENGDLLNPSELLNQPGTWEIAFNYDFIKGLTIPDDAFTASFTWGADTYTANFGTINANEWNTFVFYGGRLYEPTGWAKVTTPPTGVPEPNTLALLFVGISGLIAAHFLRRRRSAASLSVA